MPRRYTSGFANTCGDCILEFLTEYGLFLAKVATFVVAAIVLVSIIVLGLVFVQCDARVVAVALRFAL